MTDNNHRAELSQTEIALLKELDLYAPLSPGWDPQAAGLRARHTLFASALGVTEVAEMLGTNSEDIHHRIDQSELLAAKEEGCWLLPDFQFHDSQCIQGFSLLAVRLDPQEDLLWFYQWFTTPSFDVDPTQPEKAISPRDWLVAGGFATHLVQLYELNAD